MKPAQKSVPILFDTDPGVDDAMALLMLKQHPRAQLVGVTTVFGNASIDTTTGNAVLANQLPAAPQWTLSGEAKWQDEERPDDLGAASSHGPPAQPSAPYPFSETSLAPVPRCPIHPWQPRPHRRRSDDP